MVAGLTYSETNTFAVYTVNRIIYTFSIIVISSGVHDASLRAPKETPHPHPPPDSLGHTGEGSVRALCSLFQPSVRKCSFNVPLSN